MKENGHARVPQNYEKNLSLGRWVLLQRVSYKELQKGLSFHMLDN